MAKQIAKIAVIYLDGYCSENSARNLRIKVPMEFGFSEIAEIVKREFGSYPYFGIAHYEPVYAPSEPISVEYREAMSRKDNS